MVALFKALQVILALSFLILIHELGHFTFAKLFHIRVDKFYLFFDIGGVSLLKFRIGETEYGIGWLPLGGYCKIAGMVDESMDTAQLKQEPKPWEFRTHPAWQRLLVMLGGVLNNLLFAIIAYCAILGIWGSSYIPNGSAEIYASPLAEEMGFRTGDRIISMDGYIPEDFGMLHSDLVRREVRYVDVLRDGDTLRLYIDGSLTSRLLQEPLLFDLAIPFTVDSLAKGSPNTELKPADRFISINGSPAEYYQDASALLAAAAGSEAEAVVLRGNDMVTVPVTVDTLGRIGIYIARPVIASRRYEGLSCIPAGLSKTFSTMGGYLSDLKMLATPSTGAYKSVGSVIAIGQIFPSAWDWYRFLNIVALLSIMLFVMNLLPIPGLDGGHIVFTLYEMVSGRKPGDRFMMAAQMVGMVLLLALLLLAFGNDIGRLLH